MERRNNPPQPLVPVALVAAEVGCGIDELAARLGDAVITDGVGIRCLSLDSARECIAAHHARKQAEKERRAAQEAERRRQPNPLRQRVRALQRAQERFEGVDLPALAVMTAGDIEGRLEASSKRMDELMTGESPYHSLTGKEPQ